jgi:hypothetical protein
VTRTAWLSHATVSYANPDADDQQGAHRSGTGRRCPRRDRDDPAIGETGSMLARSLVAVALVGASTVAACGDDDPASEPAPESTPTPASTPTPTTAAADDDQQQYPDIVAVDVTAEGDTYRFDVTVSSPYDTPERYADAWRIVAPDGTALGIRELAHDHAAEQPFTRSLSGVVIPPDVTTVTVEGRDLVNGWGGGTRTVTLER